MTAAAASRSRTACMARPGRLRTRFLTRRVTTATIAHTSQNQPWALVNVMPPSRSALKSNGPRAEGPDRHEERMADGDLPGVAGQQVEPEGGDGRDPGKDEDRQTEVPGAERQHDIGDSQGAGPEPDGAGGEQPGRGVAPRRRGGG